MIDEMAEKPGAIAKMVAWQKLNQKYRFRVKRAI